MPNGSTYYVLNVGSYVALDDDGGGFGVQCNQSAWSTANPNQQWSIGASPPTTCSAISVTTNTYSSSIGQITWKNSGTIAETNPTLTFFLPSGATLDTSYCAFSDQTAPGCFAVSCIQISGGTQIEYDFVGSVAAGSSVTAEYSTGNTSEAAATGIGVQADSCQ